MTDLNNETYDLTIRLSNLKEAQIITILGFLEIMETDSRIGHSEYVGYYVDGDGDFHPNIETETMYKINEDRLKMMTERATKKHTHLCTLLDYDPVAWQLGKENGDW